MQEYSETVWQKDSDPVEQKDNKTVILWQFVKQSLVGNNEPNNQHALWSVAIDFS